MKRPTGFAKHAPMENALALMPDVCTSQNGRQILKSVTTHIVRIAARILAAARYPTVTLFERSGLCESL